MEYRRVTSESDIADAALLAAAAHERLTQKINALPARSAQDFAGRLEYVVGNGAIVGQFADGRLTSFLGAIAVPDFRNAGPGSYGPDWCHGFAAAVDEQASIRALYRELAPHFLEQGMRIQAFGFYAPERRAVAAMHGLGFGEIVIDAVAAASELVGIRDASPPHTVRRAEPSDSETLAELNDALARHIGASPIFLPDARGMGAEAWSAWLEDESHIALLATEGAETIGYIKAEAPAFDVSYSVQDASVLGINGMFVAPGARRRRTGAELLAALARTAQERGKTVVSVDFETANTEAHAFWLRWFTPLTVSLERRL